MSTTLLRVGDTVRILFNGKNFLKLGTVEALELDGKYANVRIKDAPHVGCIGYARDYLELVARLTPVVEEDPMTCELRVGDTVEVMFNGGIPRKGTVTTMLEVIDNRCFVVAREDGTPAPHFSERSSLKLIARAGAAPVQATPVEPPKPAKKDLKPKEFSDKGVMPSDHPGINEMLKKGFKEIFGDDMKDSSAPAKRTLPSSKALFIAASEKYMGLGFNDERA